MKAPRPAWSKHFSILLCFVLLTGFTLAIPGNYETFEILKNKRLASELKSEVGVLKLVDCKSACEEHPVCEAFSYSQFERKCVLNELKLGTSPVLNNGFVLYVRAKTKEEGYHRYETVYIKLILNRKLFSEATKKCKEMHGMLVAVRTQQLNDILIKLMRDNNVFWATIGLTDVEKEETWKYMDDGLMMFDGFSYNGKWYRRDKNCAIIGIDGLWFQANCKESRYFFCQIPMF